MKKFKQVFLQEIYNWIYDYLAIFCDLCTGCWTIEHIKTEDYSWEQELTSKQLPSMLYVVKAISLQHIVTRVID